MALGVKLVQSPLPTPHLLSPSIEMKNTPIKNAGNNLFLPWLTGGGFFVPI
jgi:hypothetical protein